MASGDRLKDIANILSLSPKTIDICQKSICSKIKINSKSELIRYAIKNNLMGGRDERAGPT
jgi:DNA-binding CsgD family transcriptional regulator